MSKRVGMEFDELCGLLIQKRRELTRTEVQRAPNRNVTRRGNATRLTQLPDSQIHGCKPYEFELVAALLQYPDTLRDIANLDPSCFESAELGSMLELLIACKSADEVARVAAMDESSDALHAVLMQHPIKLELDGEKDFKTRLLKVVNALTKRVKSNYIGRCKKKEIDIFKRQEVLANRELMDELLEQANSNNDQLSKLQGIVNPHPE